MIHILLGTRAQVIKMAPVMRLLQERGIDYNFIFLAQHRDTVYEMLDDFGLKRPDVVLGDIGGDVVTATRMVRWSLSVLASGIRNGAEVFRGDKQGIVLVHGDAPPLFLGAVIARFRGLRVASVEAGLRSFNYFRPFPEELVRVVTGKLGLIDIHFCQDETAVQNAARYAGRAVNTGGNTIVDALRLAAADEGEGDTQSRQGGSQQYAVVSLHRYETISRRGRLSQVVNLVQRIARSVDVRFVLHPPTRAALQRQGLYDELQGSPGVQLVPRLRFMAFQALLAGAEFLVTDGGSNQEESACLGKPCLLFRNETERSEGLGRNVVLSAFRTDAIDDFLQNYRQYSFDPEVATSSPSRIIVDEIAAFAGEDRRESTADRARE